ncbi:hypothetical protein BAE44_0008336 [Dichanthelium oligosanthes]|uniref:Uncharacterized protein n=1 Tax=Dichanthelium oligosanthes TaxID=888268 RepID=A0A1E5VZW1_9POAL|nr:hypothetical protein BAE44_0008336 [Dichanthelium oligosanthes]
MKLSKWEDPEQLDTLYTTSMLNHQGYTENFRSWLSIQFCDHIQRHPRMFVATYTSFHACVTMTDISIVIQACRELERSQDAAPTEDFQAKPMDLGEALAKGVQQCKNRSSICLCSGCTVRT